MKRLILIIALALTGVFSYSQDSLTKNATFVKDTTIAAKVYKIYQGSRGGRFVIVTSKTGTQYKKYLPK
jgi:hypothetical protein